MPGRVEGPASTDGADIARIRDIGFRFRVFLSLTKMEVALGIRITYSSFTLSISFSLISLCFFSIHDRILHYKRSV